MTKNGLNAGPSLPHCMKNVLNLLFVFESPSLDTIFHSQISGSYEQKLKEIPKIGFFYFGMVPQI